jgi:peroxiredoxin Q/BCP
VGAAYEAERPADDKFPTFAMRLSYLIDPEGKIARSYKVVDPAAHPIEVLGDLDELQKS